jgi:hypothetical protein
MEGCWRLTGDLPSRPQVLHGLDELVPSSNGVQIPYDDLIAAALLVYFGYNTLKVRKSMGGGTGSP